MSIRVQKKAWEGGASSARKGDLKDGAVGGNFRGDSGENSFDRLFGTRGQRGRRKVRRYLELLQESTSSREKGKNLSCRYLLQLSTNLKDRRNSLGNGAMGLFSRRGCTIDCRIRSRRRGDEGAHEEHVVSRGGGMELLNKRGEFCYHKNPLGDRRRRIGMRANKKLNFSRKVKKDEGKRG